MIKSLVTLCIFVVHIAASGAAHGASAHFGKVSLAYDIFIGGILAASVDILFRDDAAGYSIKSTARSHGFLDFLISYQGENAVTGTYQDGLAQPAEYSARSTWAGEIRTVAIQYNGAGGLRYQAQPRAEDDQREVVPEDLLPGTIDPLSALFNAVAWMSRSSRCDRRLAVFDGRRRYDFILREIEGGETAGPFFTGAARICRARREVLAGASLRRWLPQFARPEWTDIWIATVRPGLPPLPVRFQADLGIADMVAHLVAIGGRKRPPGEGLGEAPGGTEREAGTSNTTDQNNGR